MLQSLSIYQEAVCGTFTRRRLCRTGVARPLVATHMPVTKVRNINRLANQLPIATFEVLQCFASQRAGWTILLRRGPTGRHGWSLQVLKWAILGSHSGTGSVHLT
jgi:hypothetical protein